MIVPSQTIMFSLMLNSKAGMLKVPPARWLSRRRTHHLQRYGFALIRAGPAPANLHRIDKFGVVDFQAKIMQTCYQAALADHENGIVIFGTHVRLDGACACKRLRLSLPHYC